jgi:hypothetical protein
MYRKGAAQDAAASETQALSDLLAELAQKKMLINQLEEDLQIQKVHAWQALQTMKLDDAARISHVISSENEHVLQKSKDMLDATQLALEDNAKLKAQSVRDEYEQKLYKCRTDIREAAHELEHLKDADRARRARIARICKLQLELKLVQDEMAGQERTWGLDLQERKDNLQIMLNDLNNRLRKQKDMFDRDISLHEDLTELLELFAHPNPNKKRRLEVQEYQEEKVSVAFEPVPEMPEVEADVMEQMDKGEFVEEQPEVNQQLLIGEDTYGHYVTLMNFSRNSFPSMLGWKFIFHTKNVVFAFPDVPLGPNETFQIRMGGSPQNFGDDGKGGLVPAHSWLITGDTGSLIDNEEKIQASFDLVPENSEETQESTDANEGSCVVC